MAIASAASDTAFKSDIILSGSQNAAYTWATYSESTYPVDLLLYCCWHFKTVSKAALRRSFRRCEVFVDIASIPRTQNPSSSSRQPSAFARLRVMPIILRIMAKSSSVHHMSIFCCSVISSTCGTGRHPSTHGEKETTFFFLIWLVMSLDSRLLKHVSVACISLSHSSEIVANGHFLDQVQSRTKRSGTLRIRDDPLLLDSLFLLLSTPSCCW